MKKTLSAIQFVNLGKTLFDTENALKNIIDELATLDFIIQNNESEELILQHGHNRTAFRQAKILYDCLVSFPVKRCSRNAVNGHEYFHVVGLVFICVSSANDAVCSKDLINDEPVKESLKKVRNAIEKALSIIIELKQKNGIN